MPELHRQWREWEEQQAQNKKEGKADWRYYAGLVEEEDLEWVRQREEEEKLVRYYEIARVIYEFSGLDFPCEVRHLARQ